MQELRKRSNGGKTRRDNAMLLVRGDYAGQAPIEKTHRSPPYFIVKVDKLCHYLIVLAVAITMITLVSSSSANAFDSTHEVSHAGVVRETQQRINFGQRPSESSIFEVSVTIPSFIKEGKETMRFSMPPREEDSNITIDRIDSSLLNSLYKNFSPHIEDPESDGTERYQADLGGHVFERKDFEDDFLVDADEYLIEFFAFDDDLVKERRRDCRQMSFHRNHKPTCNKLHEATIFDTEYGSRYLASGAYRAAFSIFDGDVVLKTPAFDLDYE